MPVTVRDHLPRREREVAEACREGNVVRVQALLRRGRGGVEEAGEAYGVGQVERANMALREAAAAEQTEVMAWLVDEGGADVDHVCDGRGSVVWEAARMGLATTVAWLVCHGGVDVDRLCADDDGADPLPPLVAALFAGAVDVVACLLDAGAAPDLEFAGGITALCVAVDSASVDLARCLVELGRADVNKPGWTAAGGRVLTPLELAVANLDADMITYLVGDAGANCPGTLLWLPAHNGRLDIVKCLLEAGAADGVDCVGGDDAWSPLVAAVAGGFRDVVACLLEHGADVDLEVGRGVSALSMAAVGGDADMVHLLVDVGGADVNKAVGIEGCSPLALAARNGHADVAQLLVTHAAADDIAAAADIAAGEGHDAVVACLSAATS